MHPDSFPKKRKFIVEQPPNLQRTTLNRPGLNVLVRTSGVESLTGIDGAAGSATVNTAGSVHVVAARAN
jgi:hypothetical protein